MILLRPSVSPLYSFCAASDRPPGVPRRLSVADELRNIVHWFRGAQPTPAERRREAWLVDLLVAKDEAQSESEGPESSQKSEGAVLASGERSRF
jgi:hypothetical protein